MHTNSGLVQALHADGPTGPHAEQLMLFGRFVGSSRLEWSAPGSRNATGELHFGWVLGGRAVQDVWIEPLNGRVRRFIGSPQGDDIVLVSDEDDPQLRWSFSDIKPASFTWRGEVSHDGGLTWAQEEQMLATRA